MYTTKILQISYHLYTYYTPPPQNCQAFFYIIKIKNKKVYPPLHAKTDAAYAASVSQ